MGLASLVKGMIERSQVIRRHKVQVRGLLFFDAGTYKMVAARIVAHQ